MTRIPAMAEGGELTLHGAQLAPFTVKYATARGWITAELRRRQKHVQTDPEDALTRQRGRLSAVVDIGLDQVEKQQRTGATNWELVRQIARAMREVAAIPPKDKRATKPGQRDPDNGGKNAGGPTVGGLAGSIIQASRSNGQAEPATERSTEPTTQAENTEAGQPPEDHQENKEDSESGSLMHRQVAGQARLLARTR